MYLSYNITEVLTQYVDNHIPPNITYIIKIKNIKIFKIKLHLIFIVVKCSLI